MKYTIEMNTKIHIFSLLLIFYVIFILTYSNCATFSLTLKIDLANSNFKIFISKFPNEIFLHSYIYFLFSYSYFTDFIKYFQSL